MENIGKSNFLPVDSMEEVGHKTQLDQSCRNYPMPRLNNSNGCCRLCFKGNCHLQELFPGGYTEELLISKIFECTTVEITFANDPDALICYSCVAKIEEFHRYREQCRSNDIQHKNSKRHLGGKNLPALPPILIPAKYVKKEIDSEGFEISAADFFPPDTAEHSYGALDSFVDGPTAGVADSSGAVDSTIPIEDGVGNSDEDGDCDENLLELMPEQTHNEFSISYTDMNEEFENNNEVFCEMPIKEEPQDIDDGPDDDWNDFGMAEDDTMDHSTKLIPLIDNCSYSSHSEEDVEEQRPYREVYNGNDLVCLMQDGFLYLQTNKIQWRCRIKGCGAAVFQNEYSKELDTNGVSHGHIREVENSATDLEILSLLENASPSLSSESEDESFHYVKNIRKGSSIIYKGYKYSMKHRNIDGTTYWKCRSYKGCCSAALYQTPNNKFKTVGTHTHARQDLTNQRQKRYVSSVSTEGDESLGDKSSPGKIKLRIARQTDSTHSSTLKPLAGESERKKLPINQKDDIGVVRRSYDYKFVKNANGRIRLHFDGHLYVRESSRQEDTGTVVIWRCRRNYDMCGVAALQYEDGLVEVVGDHDHSPIKKMMKIPENSEGTTAYELLPTVKGGEALILDGFRYVKAYNKSNGMSLWRCTGLAGITCRVKIILSSDGVAYFLRNLKHDHSRPKHRKTVNPSTIEAAPSSTKQGDLTRAVVAVGKRPFRTGTEADTSTPIRSKAVKGGKEVHKPKDNNSGTVATSSAGGQIARASSKLQSMRNYRVIRNKKGNKALVHGGYRYCKVRTRQDGIISWFCRMNKKTCRVGLYQYPDGRLEWISHNRHNHSPTDPVEQPKCIMPAVQCAGKSTYHMDEETFVSNEWYFVRNRKNGITLIHAGYRYHRKGIRVDNTSMWRCSRANQGCRAAIVMHSNETIGKVDDIDHNHPPPNSITEEETIISGDPDESTKQSPNTSICNNDTAAELSLVNFNGCIEEQDDPEANMRTLLSTMLDVSDEATKKSSNKIVLSPTKAQYKYIKNRRLTKSLVFRGFRYSRASMKIRADGSMKWVCQMNKKTCRVSVKVLKDGSLEMDGQKHNHPQLPEDMNDQCEDDDEDNDDTMDSKHNTTLDDDSTNQDDEMDKDDAYDYFFALNRCNGTSLIFQRNRFSKESTRPDGSTIWRCMVRSDCVAKAILNVDGTCFVFRDSDHHHPPLDELPKPLNYPVQLPSVSAPVDKLPVPKLTVKGDMLIYKQNRLKKVKSYSDGTAVFKCAEVDSCISVVKIRYEETDDGESSWKVIFESAHNHPNYLTDPVIGASSSSGSTRTYSKSKRKSPIKMQKCDIDSVDYGKEYQLFKNDRGHVSLVYKGYRFSLRNHNVNGNSSWKCRANRTCSAHVTFTKDGRVVRTEADVKVMPHDHAINGKYIERGVPLEIDTLTPPANNLSQFVANWVNGLYKSELGGKMKTSSMSSTSHNDGKKTICHKNFSYKLQTIKNGREFWRCTMFKARACRAALFCSNNGTIVEYENGRQHNHEAIKPSATAVQKSTSSFRGKTHDAERTDAFYKGNEAFDTAKEVQKAVKRSHSSMHYDDQESVAEESAPAYQIVKKDGVDTLHYEKHRYMVIFSKREANNDEPKRWRCCLWNSRHQCTVELTILASGEIHFETDPTHNHRPPPPESQEIDRLPTLNTKGTRKYELLGQKIIYYKGYKFHWKEQRNSWTYYDCVCSVSQGCTVTVKVDSNGMLFECSSEGHNHHMALLNDQSDDSTALNRVKPLSERVLASREARLANCSKTGSDDYKFMRSCLGNSLAFEGHRYWLHNKLSCSLQVYRCRYQKSKSCPGSVYMDIDTQLIYHRYDAEHNHEPMPGDALAPYEQPADTTATSDSCNIADPIAELLNNSTKDDQSVDNADERDLADNDNDSSELQSEAPKNDEENENVIITPNYTFVKNYLNKNQLLFEDYVYEFFPLPYQKTSEKFYSCLFSECSASVKLLPSGNLQVLPSNQHAHERPDLTDCRDVGLGSADFKTLSVSGSGASAKTKILFEGYVYYANVSQPFQDDTRVFYCYNNMLTKEKSKSNERCSALLELLPNNRAIVTGVHHHPTPKLADGDTKAKSSSKLMMLDGRSYRYHNTHPDGTVIWQCTDDPKCKAKVYRKPNGKLVCGNTKHVLRHVKPKVTNSSTADFKISLAVSSTPAKTAAVPATAAISSNTSNTFVPNTTGNLRTKWYQGYRYNFYLTRSDGVQYWRCSKRIEEKCETGILCYPSGTIMPYNNLAHTHPVLNATAEDSQTKLPSSYSSEIGKALDTSENKMRPKYPMLNTNTANNLFVVYRGVQYSLRKRTSDGLRIYRCCNEPCNHTLIVTKRGKIISKKTTQHSCQQRPETDAGGGLVAIGTTTTATEFLSGASGLGFDRSEHEDLEIEDPDDLVDQNDSSTMEPMLKRIRLDSNIEMFEENSQENNILHTDETDAEGEEGGVPNEVSQGEMQGSIEAEPVATDTWDLEYLEQEFESTDGIDNETADSESEDRRPIADDDDECDADVGDTHDKQTIDELAVLEHSRKSFTLKTSFTNANNE